MKQLFTFLLLLISSIVQAGDFKFKIDESKKTILEMKIINGSVIGFNDECQILITNHKSNRLDLFKTASILYINGNSTLIKDDELFDLFPTKINNSGVVFGYKLITDNKNGITTRRQFLWSKDKGQFKFKL